MGIPQGLHVLLYTSHCTAAGSVVHYLVILACHRHCACVLVDGGKRTEEGVPVPNALISEGPTPTPETPDQQGCWKASGGKCPLLRSLKGWNPFLGASMPPWVLCCLPPPHLSPESMVGTSKASGRLSINSLFVGGPGDNNLKN